jgi:hypothetical protein
MGVRAIRLVLYPIKNAIVGGAPDCHFLSIRHNSGLKSVSNREEAKMTNRLRTLLLPALLSSALVGVTAQPPAGPPPFDPTASIHSSLMNLADQPASHTSFSFDRTELQVAQNLLLSGGLDANRAAAALTGISVDNYHYPRPAFYTPEVMASIIDTYHAAGWKHLVNANQSPANTAQPHSSVTDLWLHFNGPDITGVTVLTRAPSNMSVVQITCELRPLDLVHLSGHFGIPKVDPNAVMVPAPDGK